MLGFRLSNSMRYAIRRLPRRQKKEADLWAACLVGGGPRRMTMLLIAGHLQLHRFSDDISWPSKRLCSSKNGHF